MYLTVFANFKIDSQERLLRMKDSYHSFKNKKINQWIINIRGKYKQSAIEFLDKQISKKLDISTIESGNGWFFDSKILSKKILNNYIFLWTEDHICTCGQKKLNLIINEIKKYNIEYLGYSWFGNGLFLNEFKNIKKKEAKYLFFLKYDKLVHKNRCSNAEPIIGIKPYILGLQGIFRKKIFLKILNSKKPFLRRWHKDTPFDFEKTSSDTWILPLKFGIPKFEMFSSIDDDNRYSGSSLISRKLYPKRVSRFKLSERERQSSNIPLQILKKLAKKILFFSWLQNLVKRISYHF